MLPAVHCMSLFVTVRQVSLITARAFHGENIKSIDTRSLKLELIGFTALRRILAIIW